jgi:hypothetical protein
VVISRPEAILPLFNAEDAISALVKVAKRTPQTDMRVVVRQSKAPLIERSLARFAH